MVTENSASLPKQFTIAIIGGGIGGLTLAIGLIQRNVRVQIYEAAAAFTDVGLGLSIGPAAHRAMQLIDPHIQEIYDSLVTTHADSSGYEQYRQTWFEIVWATGDQAGQVLLDLKAPPSGQTTLRRADFVDKLVDLIPPGVAQFGKRLLSLQETSTEVRLSFADGTSATADAVIGCDGIRSKVKESMLPDERGEMGLRYSGMYCYRGVLKMGDMVEAVGEQRARVSTLYLGKEAYVVSYPIMHATEVNVGLYTFSKTWDSDNLRCLARKDDMYRDFGHMGDNVKALMERMPDPTQWAIFECPPISTFSKSRVAILGDAAHASTPHLGAGAGQAIEDAHVLTELLSDPSVRNIEHVKAALHVYGAVRQPRCQRVVSASREQADLLCLCHQDVKDDAQKLKETLQKRCLWLWDLDVSAQAENARTFMHAMLEKLD